MNQPHAATVQVLPVLLISAVVLALEVLLTRILSYSVHTMLLYTVLGIALLGFGAAGSLVALRHHWLSPQRLDRALGWSALATSVAIVVGYGAFTRITPALQHLNMASFAAALLLTLPFLAAATTVTLAIASAGGAVGRCYGANLVGSGLGCFLPLALLGPLTGEQLLAVLALGAWAAARFYVRRVPEGDTLHTASWAVLGMGLLTLGASGHVFAIQPEPPPLGQAVVISDWAKERDIRVRKSFDRWNGTGRIEVYEYSNVEGAPDPYPFHFYAQDSSAGSTLFEWDGKDRDADYPGPDNPGAHVSRLCTQTVYGQAYYRRRASVLVIGIGGGPDLQCALYHKSGQVDAVEINPDAIAAVRGPFNEWLGGIGKDPRIRFHETDGRAFVHGAKHGKYDLIQISGTDTKQTLAAGSLALAENLLYTREAFLDYLRALSPIGTVVFLRFGEAEALRLANTAVTALEELGEKNPAGHIAMFRSGIVHGVMIRRTPFPMEELLALQKHLRPKHFQGLSIFFYDIFNYPVGRPVELLYTPGAAFANRFGRYFGYVSAGNRQQFIDSYGFDITPVDDDRPFFFDVFRYDRGLTWGTAYHVVTLRNLTLALLALSILMIVAPLSRMRERLRGRAAARAVGFFSAIGLGFLFVEVWMLHRFAVFLGHQTYALSVVLSALLISSGIGAATGHRWMRTPSRQGLAGGVGTLLLLGVGLSALSPLLESTWSLDRPLRALCAIGFIAPTGYLMGMLMPAGLRWVGTTAQGALPWCIGINAFASVLATVLVLPAALWLGYQNVLLIGMGLYALAVLLSVGMKAAR